MSQREGTLPADYFEVMYSANADPWGYETSDYERAKLEATLSALRRCAYKNVLEIGCSIGVMTRRLAERSGALLSVDAAAAALQRARERCVDLHNVTFAHMHVPNEWPRGRYDLIVLSEIVYYLDREDIRRLAARMASVAQRETEIVLVHWLGLAWFPLAGNESVEHLVDDTAAFARPVYQARTDQYRLDILKVGGAVRS